MGRDCLGERWGLSGKGVMGSDCNMIRPSSQVEAGLPRSGAGGATAPGAPLTLPLYYTEEKSLTYSKAHS